MLPRAVISRGRATTESQLPQRQIIEGLVEASQGEPIKIGPGEGDFTIGGGQTVVGHSGLDGHG
ncbi:hypothetical protein IQ216_02025 [Cyanobium sp. LEGE 06143]|nr:hypothetical protein [Cyanobium sp. LEGE 06143]